MNKKISTGVGIGVVVIAAVVCSIGVWIASRQPNQSQSMRAETQKLIPGKVGNRIQSVNNDSQQKDSIHAEADWETYKNNQYGFEIQYPPFLKNRMDRVGSQNENEIQTVLNLLADDGGSMIASALKEKLDPKNISVMSGKIDDKNLKKVVVDGVTSYSFSTSGRESRGDIIRIPHGSETIEISFLTYCHQCIDVVQYENSILSTFKFTK
jgi:hypothetical protein